MPRIGSGLDRLNWQQVKRLIEEVFVDEHVKIAFQRCNLYVSRILNVNLTLKQHVHWYIFHVIQASVSSGVEFHTMQCTNSTPCNVHCAQPVRGYFTYGQCCITLNVPIFFREGCTNENPEKVWSFAKLPSDPLVGRPIVVTTGIKPRS